MSETRVGFVADIINGFPFPSSDFRSEEGTPLVRIRDILATEFSTFVPRGKIPDEAWIRDGDVVVGMDGDFNSVVWSRGPAALNQRVCLLRVHQEHDPRFVDYAIQDELKRVNTIAYATTVKHLSASDVFNLRLPALNTGEQRRVANYLDREIAEMDAINASLDKLIETLRHRARTLQTRLAFGLAADLQMTTSNSVLAGIPSSWSTTRFGIDFVESTERNGDNPVGPLLSISEYRGVELNERTDGQQASEDVSNYRVVHPGQLAANMMWLNHGGVGVSDLCGYISPDYKAFWISDRFEPRYVHYLFRSSRYIDFFEAIATGVRPNAKRVTKTTLGMTPVPMPPLDEQRRIADELDAGTSRLEAMIAGAERLKALLAERKSTLITEVVTGRKEVSAA